LPLRGGSVRLMEGLCPKAAESFILCAACALHSLTTERTGGPPAHYKPTESPAVRMS